MSIDIKSEVILYNLKSTDSKHLLNTIDKIRKSGNSLLLDGLIDLLHNTEHSEIKHSVLNLLSELKDKSCIPDLITALKNEKYINERKELVACCWQNGLIYKDYLSFFIDLVIHEDFLVAFEAFTVIENMYGKVEDQVIAKEIIKVKDALINASEAKAYLLKRIIDNYQGYT